MRIEGSHTFNAPRVRVWSILQDPETLQQALPGCEQIDQITAFDFAAIMHIHQGPFKGKYRGTVQLSNVEMDEAKEMILEGQGPEGSLWGRGTVALDEKDGRTTMRYEGDVEVTGHTASTSPRLLETTANSLIRQFFEAIDRQIQIQTGIHTTNGIESLPRSCGPGTIDLQDLVAEDKQARRTTIFVLVLFILLSLMTMGAIWIVVLLAKWGVRIFDRRVISIIHERNNDTVSLDVA